MVVFDADDTLWETQVLYNCAKGRFLSAMEGAGFPPEAARERLEAIDQANVSRLGFSKRRFPQSMRDTYKALCIAYSRRFEEEKAAGVEAIGASVFNVSPRVVEGVREALDELRASGLKLVLATKGDREVQEQRVESSRLRQYFDRVYVLAHKGAKEFQEIVTEAGMDASRAWSVGNSVRSDINPALAVGLHAIWIPNKTWVYEHEEPVASPRLHRAESIREVPDIVLGGE